MLKAMYFHHVLLASLSSSVFVLFFYVDWWCWWVDLVVVFEGADGVDRRATVESAR